MKYIRQNPSEPAPLLKTVLRFHLDLFWKSAGFNDHAHFQHQKLSQGCAKLRHSHRQLVGENSSKFQGETPSIQKSDRDVGWSLNSPKTCICTRQNIMGFYSCLVCLGSVQPSLLRWHFWGVASSQSTPWSGKSTEGFQPGSGLTPSVPVASSTAF